MGNHSLVAPIFVGAPLDGARGRRQAPPLRQTMKLSTHFLRLFVLFVAIPALAFSAPDPTSVVPATAPRTLVLAGRLDSFRAYCTTGPGAKPFAKIRADLDAKYLALPFPAE